MKAASPFTVLNHRYRLETGGCPIEAAFDALGGRWKGLLLFCIAEGPCRFHELRKRIPQISQRMLVRQLKELERDGLILRTIRLGVPAAVDYSPTAATHELMPLLRGLRDWSARHLLGISGEALNAQLQSYQNAVRTRAADTRPARR